MEEQKFQFLTIRLRLRDKHAAELGRQARAVSVVWNYCNEMQQKAVLSGRRWLYSHALERLTAGSGAMLGLHSHTVKKICQAYERCRSERRKPWLRFRSRRSLGWVPFSKEHLKIVAGHRVKFKGVLYEPMHWREMPLGATVVGTGAFNQDSKGHWYINIPVKVPCVTRRRSLARIGVDLGLQNFAALSDGQLFKMPSFYRKSERAIIRADRAGKRKRSKRLHAAVANRRKDYLHKLSKQLSEEFGTIVVGNVSPIGVTSIKLGKSVGDAGWSTFRNMLSYKTHLRGGSFLEVSEHLTSQTCSSCGQLPPERPRGIAGLGIREFSCICGAVLDRDVNAARNILARGLASLEEGAAQMRSSQIRRLESEGSVELSG